MSKRKETKTSGDPASRSKNKKREPTLSETKEPKETKLATIIRLLSRPEGATLSDIIEATSWQPHTVRAALSYALGKKRGYQIVSDKPQGGQRIYKIAGQAKDDH
ncbi:MAG: DUF3489 domain-containing protein [Alphaproteobacteria bacterium]|nr:DUF3489 domain-containing protein [Alphaproteobacteria bacterium]